MANIIAHIYEFETGGVGDGFPADVHSQFGFLPARYGVSEKTGKLYVELPPDLSPNSLHIIEAIAQANQQ